MENRFPNIPTPESMARLDYLRHLQKKRQERRETFTRVALWVLGAQCVFLGIFFLFRAVTTGL